MITIRTSNRNGKIDIITTDRNGKVDIITIKKEMLKNKMQSLRYIYGLKMVNNMAGIVAVEKARETLGRLLKLKEIKN